MNRFKCPACGGNQYTACDTAEGCIYCGHQKLEKKEILEPEEARRNFRSDYSPTVEGIVVGRGITPIRRR